MADEKEVDYTAVLADLEAKRDKLDAAIEAIRLVSGMGASTGSSVEGKRVGSDTQDLSDDAFFGMSVPDAAKKYLGIVRKTKSTKEIAEALLKGGMPSRSQNFSNTVYMGLLREEKAGGVTKVGTKWGLASWYPGRPRKKAAQGSTEEPDDEQQSDAEDDAKAAS